MNTPDGIRVSARLELRPVPWTAIAAVVAGDRLGGWAEDFPDIGDRVIGGAGFFGPPEDGGTEIGYGIVPSRQGNGYATEAVRTLLAIAWEQPGTGAVIATTEDANVASQRVLEKTGFVLEAAAAERRYRVDRPARAAPAPD